MGVDPIIWAASAAFLSLFMAQAGLHKLLRRDEFLVALEGYDLLPKSAHAPAASLLALIELGLALAILLPPVSAMAALGCAGLLTFYALAMVSTVLRGRAGVDCGCSWGRLQSPVGWSAIARNILLVAFALVCALPFGRSASPLDVANGVLAALAAAVIITAWKTAAANRTMISAIRGRMPS